MTFYVILFDRQPDKSYSAFHEDFVRHPNILRWWHYIKSAYIVGTNFSAGQLSSYVRATAKKHGLNTTHLVMKLDMRYRQGMLTRDAWEWIRGNAT